jgi:hypothetical protein
MSQNGADTAQRAGQDKYSASQAQDPYEPQGPQGTEHRQRDDCEIEEMMRNKPSARRREIQLGKVLDDEDRPDYVVDAVERIRDAN